MNNQKNQSQNKVVKAGAGYIIGNYLLKGITFLSAPIFTRLLTTEEYGKFGAYMSYEGILYIIIGLALHSSITNAKYKYKERFEEYVSSAVLLTGISTVSWIVLANVLYNLYGGFVDLPRTVINILLLHCFGSAMLQFFNSYVSLSYRVKAFLKLTMINALSNMALSIVLLLTFFNNSRFLGRVIGAAFPLFAIAVYIVLWFFKKSKPTVNVQYWKFGLRYSLPIIPHGISQVILSSFDRIMIDGMIGSFSAGLYSFAYTINSLVMVFATSLDRVWKPWFYERMDKKEYDVIKRQATKYALGIAIFTALVVMASPEVIMILGAEQYWGTANCVIPVVIGGFFSYIYTIPVYVEYFYGKTKCIAVGSMLAAGINVLLNYIFIPQYGYIAAAYTTLVTYILYFVFHYILAIKIHGECLFSSVKLLLIGIGIIVVGLVGLILQDYFAVRFIIDICLLVLALLWADKCFGVVALVKKKLGRR